MSQVEIPTEKLFKQKLGHKNAWADHYGALHVAADYCDIRMRMLPFSGIWQHGCFGPWDNHIPSILTYHAPDIGNRPVFVARRDQIQTLNDQGYSNVHAIGLPFVYLPEVDVARKKNSLLVVPTHTLAGILFEETQLLDDYADIIKKNAEQFTDVKVCVHPGCLENGYWLKQFEDRGIECIIGARTNDANALLRMKMLFSQFEFVTTNGWGSHVAYALYCGAKVSIFGTPPSRSFESMLKDTGWGRNYNAIRKALSPEFQMQRKRFLSKFYVSPDEGIQDIDFGRWLVGGDNKRSSIEIKNLFKWTLFNRIFFFFN